MVLNAGLKRLASGDQRRLTGKWQRIRGASRRCASAIFVQIYVYLLYFTKQLTKDLAVSNGSTLTVHHQLQFLCTPTVLNAIGVYSALGPTKLTIKC